MNSECSVLLHQNMVFAPMQNVQCSAIDFGSVMLYSLTVRVNEQHNCAKQHNGICNRYFGYRCVITFRFVKRLFEFHANWLRKCSHLNVLHLQNQRAYAFAPYMDK